jgi:hypothetical protein
MIRPSIIETSIFRWPRLTGLWGQIGMAGSTNFRANFVVVELLLMCHLQIYFPKWKSGHPEVAPGWIQHAEIMSEYISPK